MRKLISAPHAQGGTRDSRSARARALGLDIGKTNRGPAGISVSIQAAVKTGPTRVDTNHDQRRGLVFTRA